MFVIMGHFNFSLNPNTLTQSLSDRTLQNPVAFDFFITQFLSLRVGISKIGLRHSSTTPKRKVLCKFEAIRPSSFAVIVIISQ